MGGAASRSSLSAGIVLLAVAVSGCAVQVQSCPGWAFFDTPADAVRASTAVVFGHVGEMVDTQSMYGASANVWSFEVQEWRKGEGPNEIEVVSPPEQCGTTKDPYFGGDPFRRAANHELSAVFLVEREGRWSALTPLQGILEIPGGGELPDAWDAVTN